MNSLKTISISKNAVEINFEKYCRGVISSKGGSDNFLRN